MPIGDAAGDILAYIVLTLVLEGNMSAKTMCTIAVWSARAGAEGKIRDFAYRPDA